MSPGLTILISWRPDARVNFFTVKLPSVGVAWVAVPSTTSFADGLTRLPLTISFFLPGLYLAFLISGMLSGSRTLIWIEALAVALD